VESGNRGLREGTVAEDLLDPLAHLFGCLVREGDGEDVVWRDSSLLY